MRHVLTGALLILALQGSPGSAVAAPDDPPTTASLMAQASDPAVIAPAAAGTNVAQEQPAEGLFAPDQLEQLVAPIALYPDALLMQILMASTYPLEIVEADRWIRPQPDLKGDALDKALLDKDWDPSVKSLTTLPSVLKQMSENLDWTQDLGDAFLGQQNELLDTVQTMRGKAYESGNLQTTEQQTVTQNADKIIVIQQASPEVVYVPTYSPTVVYGPYWGYSSWYYPPMYPYYPPGYGLVAFGVGIAVGGAIWGGCRWGWGNNNVDIDINRQNNFNRNTNRNGGDRGQGNRGQGGRQTWQHDASHRKGVNYKSKDVAQRNGANAGTNRVSRDQARGRSTSPTASNRAGAGTQAQNRPAGAGSNAQNRPAGAGSNAQNRPAGAGSNAQNRSAGSQGNRASSTNRSQSAGSSAYNPSRSNSSGSNSAFSGSRNPTSDRMSSTRGASSRGTRSYGGARGGGMRGGGGRRR